MRRVHGALQTLTEYLDRSGISYEVDESIVRGLDYYTTTVFEIKADGLVICGGGRYNGLVEELGGKPTPGVGFGLGLERLILVMENNGLFPEKKKRLYAVYCQYRRGGGLCRPEACRRAAQRRYCLREGPGRQKF